MSPFSECLNALLYSTKRNLSRPPLTSHVWGKPRCLKSESGLKLVSSFCSYLVNHDPHFPLPVFFGVVFQNQFHVTFTTTTQVWSLTHFFIIVLVKKSIGLDGKKNVLLRFSQQLLRFHLGPLEGFLS